VKNIKYGKKIKVVNGKHTIWIWILEEIIPEYSIKDIQLNANKKIL